MKQEEKMKKEEYLYHNTLLLLKNYRDVVWSIEASVAQLEINFEIEYGSKIDEFLELSYAAGADLSGTDIEEQMRTVERNRKMLRIIDRAIELLKKKHKDGRLYYAIINYTYLSDEEFETTENIINRLEKDEFYISSKTFYRRKKEAIKCFGNLLWGFATPETNKTLHLFIAE